MLFPALLTPSRQMRATAPCFLPKHFFEKLGEEGAQKRKAAASTATAGSENGLNACSGDVRDFYDRSCGE
jgi:hypothetical protein